MSSNNNNNNSNNPNNASVEDLLAAAAALPKMEECFEAHATPEVDPPTSEDQIDPDLIREAMDVLAEAGYTVEAPKKEAPAEAPAEVTEAGFFRRHWGKIAVTAAVCVGVAYALSGGEVDEEILEICEDLESKKLRNVRPSGAGRFFLVRRICTFSWHMLLVYNHAFFRRT